MHELLASTLDIVVEEIREIQSEARVYGYKKRPVWPMIIFRSPKGWTGPKVVDGLPVEGTWRAHQVPLAELATKPEHVQMLEAGIDIQHFMINHKIERVKELLQYKKLNLTEISCKLHYSSVSHLSNQFKKVTGLSPSTYMHQRQKRWSNLENM